MLESRKKVIQVELAFVVKVLEPMYQTITALQANTGAILNTLSIFTEYALLTSQFSVSSFLADCKVVFNNIQKICPTKSGR